MASKAAKFGQDRPPPGGYAEIEWTRKLTGKRISGAKLFGALITMKAVAFCWWRFRTLPWREREQLELNDCRIAVAPLYLAESDRMYLKHLRAVRDEERELMKNVPGWEVGKLYREPIYNNVRERFIMPERSELIIHSKEGKVYV